MKTLYLTRGHNIVIDQETNDVNKLSSDRQAIDYIYMVDEPMHVVYGSGDKHCEADADAGDIIVTFYTDTFTIPMVVIKNDQWRENILENRKKEQERKEKWAAEKQCPDCESISKG